ncbi:unnamed protein product, partial [Prorocentrum cordatum]
MRAAAPTINEVTFEPGARVQGEALGNLQNLDVHINASRRRDAQPMTTPNAGEHVEALFQHLNDPRCALNYLRGDHGFIADRCLSDAPRDENYGRQPDPTILTVRSKSTHHKQAIANMVSEWLQPANMQVDTDWKIEDPENQPIIYKRDEFRQFMEAALNCEETPLPPPLKVAYHKRLVKAAAQHARTCMIVCSPNDRLSRLTVLRPADRSGGGALAVGAAVGGPPPPCADVVVSPFGAARGGGVRGHRGGGVRGHRGGGRGGGGGGRGGGGALSAVGGGAICLGDISSDDGFAELGEVLRVDTYDLGGVDVGVGHHGKVGRNFQVFLRDNLLQEICSHAEAFWLRRSARRAVLRRLAEDCARFATEVRRRAAELRSEAAKARLAMLRGGDLEGYAEALAATKESRLQEVLEETTRILAELPPPCAGGGAEKPPSQVLRNGELLPHQLFGFRWLAQIIDNRMNGILADDMGLGKTVQVLALIGHLLEAQNEKGPHLVIVPLSVMHHWADEIVVWLPDVRFVIFRGPRKDMKGIMDDLGKGTNEANIVLTTYETAVSHHEFLSRVPWHLLIADEGHKLKNIKTRAAQVCHSLPCRRRLLLTGTPLQNSLRELWSLLVFVAPRSFSSLGDFEQWFALPSAQAHRREDAAREDGGHSEPPAEVVQPLTEEEELLVIQRLHSVLRPFLLRRTKGAVLKDLPSKREVVIWVPISAWQRTLYRRGLRGARSESDDVAAKASMMALRKALNHPCHFLPEK